MVIYAGDTAPAASGKIVADQPLASVVFSMRPANGSELELDHVSADVLDADTGDVSYSWAPGDTDDGGLRVGWFTATLEDDTIRSGPAFDIEIIDYSLPSGLLCTVADVRQAMGLPDVATGSDGQIQNYIEEASREIMKEVGREFAPITKAATRRFRIKNGRADFYPYDLNKVTKVVLHPESFERELVGGDGADYQLRPYPNPDGVWTSLKISPWIATVSRTAMKYGDPLVDVTGDWGFLEVPIDVKRACVIAVRSWLRRDSAALSSHVESSDTDIQPRPVGTYVLPRASIKLIDRYRRWLRVR